MFLKEILMALHPLPVFLIPIDLPERLGLQSSALSPLHSISCCTLSVPSLTYLSHTYLCPYAHKILLI